MGKGSGGCTERDSIVISSTPDGIIGGPILPQPDDIFTSIHQAEAEAYYGEEVEAIAHPALDPYEEFDVRINRETAEQVLALLPDNPSTATLRKQLTKKLHQERRAVKLRRMQKGCWWSKDGKWTFNLQSDGWHVIPTNTKLMHKMNQQGLSGIRFVTLREATRAIDSFEEMLAE